MAYTTDYLYQLLPAVYRLRDAERGEPLRALVAVIAEQAALMEGDISRLYENWFIETCDEWVVPYIGDLLGVQGLHPVTTATFSQRARVANTLGYRRRKGTASMLEQLARDTTGWPARVTESFRLLATTQHVNHVRPDNLRTPDLRDIDRLDLIGGPFDGVARTADVRHVDNGRGGHNIMNVHTHFWRLQAYPVVHAPAFSHGDGTFSFSQLGHDVPLFTHPAIESEITHIATETDVPAPIRRLALRASLALDHDRYYGAGSSLRILIDDKEVPRELIVACNLDRWAHRPEQNRVAVDPVLGRMVFRLERNPGAGAVRVDYHYGASSEVGGGCYLRPVSDTPFARYRIAKSGEELDSVEKAVARWANEGSPDAVLEIQDNDIYDEALALDVPAATTLEIRAANQRRPVIRLSAPLTITGGGSVNLDGLLVTGQPIRIQPERLSSVTLTHCTLVPGLALTPRGQPAAPGTPSIVADGAQPGFRMAVTRSIVGGLLLDDGTLTAADSLIDGTGGAAVRAGTLTVRDSTVFGSVTAALIEEASNCIFTEAVHATRKQAGCVRYCYLPATSDVPRRYRCQPDLAVRDAIEAGARAQSRLSSAERDAIRTRVHPVFTSVRYGTPAYGQLDAQCPVEIAAGADDQAEMGVYRHLKQPQRESNFRASLGEYLRLGLEAGYTVRHDG